MQSCLAILQFVVAFCRLPQQILGPAIDEALLAYLCSRFNTCTCMTDKDYMLQKCGGAALY